MKISDVDGVKGAGKPKKPKKTGDKGAFDAALSAAEETEAVAAPASVGGVEAPSSLLSLQEVPAGAGLREQTMQQGKKSLDMLEELRRDLLLGDDSDHTLQRMRDQQSRMKQQVYDPQLKQVMDDIDLRLAVEIAKRETSFA
ncbi:MAG: flagellar assembly protein FliX [Rickettsiales bacterium]|nr:flagellar assembly protein FliX [Rickettsiales bacterium]